MIRFEKISFEQYYKDYIHWYGATEEARVRQIYEGIALPMRKTEGSAGYDFSLPEAMVFDGEKPVQILSGIRALMPQGVVLLLAPRSGLGTRHGMALANTVGIIDSDYAGADNEGHIMGRFHLARGEQCALEAGAGYMQGLFLPYLVTDDDDAKSKRTGGFGSTDAQGPA